MYIMYPGCLKQCYAAVSATWNASLLTLPTTSSISDCSTLMRSLPRSELVVSPDFQCIPYCLVDASVLIITAFGYTNEIYL